MSDRRRLPGPAARGSATAAARACAILLALCGCGALTSKGQPLEAQYFNLDPAAGNAAGREHPVAEGNPGGNPDGDPGNPGQPPAELRLGRVTGAPHLEERLVHRDSDHEIRYYADARWTEPPQNFLKRRLVHTLFEQGRLRHAVGGLAPVLDVHLAAFEEIRSPRHVARVQVVATLHDERLVLWERTMTVEQPIEAAGGAGDRSATVAALAKAMQVLVDRLADDVVREIRKSAGTDSAP